MKQLEIKVLFIVLLNMIGTLIFAHDIEVKNANGITIYYNWNDNKTELSVTYRGRFSHSYQNNYSGSIVIPDSVIYEDKTYKVTSIGYQAFYDCNKMTSVTISNNVADIGENAFAGCVGLNSIIIPNSVTSIGKNAFIGTGWYNYQNEGLMYLSNWLLGFKGSNPIGDIKIANGSKGIANYAFNNCLSVNSIIIPNSVTMVGEKAFQGCNNLTSVTFHCNSIGSWFRNLTSIKEIIIGDEVTSICDHAFYGCTGLTSVTIGNSVKTIGISAFDGCTGLTNITIPNSVTSIGNSAFSGCTGLTSVTIGNSVKTIGIAAFGRCTGLTNITIPNSVTYIDLYAFYDTYIKSFTIGTGVLTIKREVFSNSSRPAKVIWLTNTPPDGYQEATGTVNYVANDSYKNLSNKTVYPFLSSLFEVDGVKYVPVSPSERTCDAIDCAYNESAERITIGKTVAYKGIDMTIKNVNRYVCCGNPYIEDVDLSFDSNLGNYAFQGCTSIAKVNIRNVGKIGDYSFQNCSALETATLGKEITSIGQYAFGGCSKLQGVVIPDAVTSVGSYAFSGCNSMMSARMGTGITSINDYVFHNCSSLTDMQIGSNVKTIGTCAFQNCSSLPTIQIPKSVTNIQGYVFSGCKSLKAVRMDDQETELKLGCNDSKPLFADCPLDSVYIGRNISYPTISNYGYSPFYRNTTLRSVTITDKETEISQNEFYGCTNLKNVSIGDGVTTIGDWAFSGCSSLDYFAFGNNVKTIGKEAFSDCTAMTRIISHATTPPTCGSQALDDINKWNCTLSVPEGSITAYQQADQWKDFFFMDNDMTKVGALTKSNAAPTYIYDLNGRKNVSTKSGLNIIKKNDGSIRKIMIK